MNTKDIEIALFESFDRKKYIVAPRMRYFPNSTYEMDMLVIEDNSESKAIEIEIKISKQDILNESKKYHNHNNKNISSFYYAVPEPLVQFALSSIHKDAGLISISVSESGHVARTVRKAKKRDCVKFDLMERYYILRTCNSKNYFYEKKIRDMQIEIENLKFQNNHLN